METPSRVTRTQSASGPANTPPPPTYIRPRAAEAPEILTPAQQTLNARLHDWRKTEAEKLGLPQFFVLSSSTLRGIVLLQPRSLDHLKTISGMGAEKIDRFGPAILAVCAS